MQTRVMRRASGETAAESLLHEIASWWLFGCGIVYTVAVSAAAVVDLAWSPSAGK